MCLNKKARPTIEALSIWMTNTFKIVKETKFYVLGDSFNNT